MDWNKIEKISNETLKEMGGSALEICTGDCTTFAKKMIDTLISEGIKAVIIDNLHGEAMKEELGGYPVEQPDYDSDISHCYVKIESWYFDAFDVDGCDDETKMQYIDACRN